MLLHDFFSDTVERLPDKVALVCEDARFTYADLHNRVNALAATLRARGVMRGDRVALFLDNTPEMVVAVYATLQVGAVFMPVNPLTKQDKILYLLQDSRASALVTDASLSQAWQDALAASKSVHTCFIANFATLSVEGFPADARCVPFPSAADALGSAHSPAPSEPLIDQDLASIIYTSGSTGEPKGVMLTHLNMVSACRSVSGYLGLRETDVVLCALPLAFDYGLYQLLMSVKVGATLVLAQSFAFPLKVLETMEREHVTVLPGVPTIFSMLMHLSVLDQFPLTCLRMITNTAAALSEEHIRRLRALFPQATLFSMYGLTECKRVTYLPPEQLDIRPTSVGQACLTRKSGLLMSLAHGCRTEAQVSSSFADPTSCVVTGESQKRPQKNCGLVRLPVK
jgi:long-chain acyl-CoA synthetase